MYEFLLCSYTLQQYFADNYKMYTFIFNVRTEAFLIYITTHTECIGCSTMSKPHVIRLPSAPNKFNYPKLVLKKLQDKILKKNIVRTPLALFTIIRGFC